MAQDITARFSGARQKRLIQDTPDPPLEMTALFADLTVPFQSVSEKQPSHTILEWGWLHGNKSADGTCRNLWRDYDALWTFVCVAGVEPSNNTAERGPRAGIVT